MIKVIAKLTIKEGKVEEFKSAVQNLITETRKEDGCNSYQLFEDVKNKQVLSFVEDWESMEDLKRHMNSKHFKEAVPKFAELQENEMEVSMYKLVI